MGKTYWSFKDKEKRWTVILESRRENGLVAEGKYDRNVGFFSPPSQLRGQGARVDITQSSLELRVFVTRKLHLRAG